MAVTVQTGWTSSSQSPEAFPEETVCPSEDSALPQRVNSAGPISWPLGGWPQEDLPSGAWVKIHWETHPSKENVDTFSPYQ